MAQAYKPIVAFGKRAGYVDTCYDNLLCDDEGTATSALQTSAQDATYEALLDASELADADCMLEPGLVQGSKSNRSEARAFAKSLNAQWRDVFQGMVSIPQRAHS